MDPNEFPQKRKGDAENIEDKKKATLEEDIESCMEVTAFLATSKSVPQTDELKKTNEDPVDESNVTYMDFQTSAILPGVVADSSAVHSEAASSSKAGRGELEYEQRACSDGKTEVAAKPFCRPSPNELSSFFKSHPCQPLKNLPFKAEKAYYKDDGIKRLWLSYSVQKRCLFCTVCLAHSKLSDSSAFIDGFDTWSQTYILLKEHEKTTLHTNCALAHLEYDSERDSLGSLFSTAVTKKNEQVVQRRKVLERIISVVKLVCKRGLSCRGIQFESAFTLANTTVDHGNFLDILLALAEYDFILKRHLEEAAKASLKRPHSSKTKNVVATSRGRGSRGILISKTVVNYIIDIICHLIQHQIAKEIRIAGLYSIQIDSIQGITDTDQVSIIVRYVNDEVYERLLAIVDCHSSTGKNLIEMVQKILSAHGLDVACCVSDSTDGASTMSGQYNEFTAWLEKSSPGHVHILCYAHVLNRVLCDVTESNSASACLFGLLQSCATFFQELFLRMDSWKVEMGELIGPVKLNHLTKIGTINWWSKDEALSKVFGSESCADPLFFELVSVLHAIAASKDFNTKTRFTAQSYLSVFLKYETILMAHTYLQIFALTTPLSINLQFFGLDFLMAQTMIDSTIESLRVLARDLDKIVKNTDLFIRHHNDKCEETVDCCIETSLPSVRIAKKKKMTGELAEDEAPLEPMHKFRIDVYNVVFDEAITCMEMRFQQHGELFADFSLFDPENFEDITSHLLENSCQLVRKNVLEKVSCMLAHYYNDLKTSSTILADLKQELSDFAIKWPTFKNGVPMDYKLLRESIELDEDRPNGFASVFATNWKFTSGLDMSCQNCVRCAHVFLLRHNMFGSTYSLVYRAYKLLLTLPVAQTACYATFSKLKAVKYTARDALTKDHLNSCILMGVERDILKDIQSEDVINILASKTPELKHLLAL